MRNTSLQRQVIWPQSEKNPRSEPMKGWAVYFFFLFFDFPKRQPCVSHCPTCLPHVHPSACVCSGTNNVRHRYVALKVFRCSRPMSAVPHLFMSEFFLFNKIIKMRIDRRTWRFFFSQTQRCDSRSALIVMTSQEMLQSISIKKKQLDFL